MRYEKKWVVVKEKNSKYLVGIYFAPYHSISNILHLFIPVENHNKVYAYRIV